MQHFNSRLLLTPLILLFGSLVLTTANAQASLVRVSGPSPFAGCNVDALTFTEFGELNYLNAEVEPFVAVNARSPEHIVGVWQQDRWSFGGARGLVTGVSHDGGTSWTTTFPHFSLCAGGMASNGGNYERASDPWVTIAPNGGVYQIALSFDLRNDANQAILVSRSTDNGETWSNPTALITDTDPNVADDKESITADPKHSRFVYAVWDRLQFDSTPPFPEISGPTWFARTTNRGESWEPAKIIYDPGTDASTISNEVVVLPNGTLIDLFVRFLHFNEGSTNPGDVTLAIVRSQDRGLTWSAPLVINTVESIGVVDLKNGVPLRTGDVIPSIAVDRGSGTVYVVWQDARFSNHQRDGVVFSKSVDGGLSWSAPVQVNRVPTVQAFTAAVDVNEDGGVAVTYYDLRKDTPDPNVLLTDYWQITSEDGGATWQERHIGGSFDMTTAPVAGGYFVGDYEGLRHQDESFLPFFAMTNSGNLNNRTDVFAALSDEAEDRGNSHVEINATPRSLKERVESHRERKPH
jgi:hypothetical protein